jgi:superfamily II DNA helicase RecQ
MGSVEGKALNPPQTHTVGSAEDWVVVEGADKEPTVQAYTAFRERMLPLMPKVSQHGVLKPAEPREGQVRSLYHLCEDRRDVILSAKTGFGKSIIFQLAPLLRSGICLIISPLNALSDGQLESLNELEEAGAKGVVINHESNTREIRHQAASGKFTHGIYPTPSSSPLSELGLM